jgi:hydroxyquinol 1,2-dioxygenase
MRNFDEATITDAVLQRVRAAKDDRIRQVSEALVRHLHAFVREIEPTQAEWEAGIDFLTRTGQMCDDKRQEFILLSDTLGVSMLVDAVNHRTPQGATETTVLGPFYVQRAPEHPLGADISGTMEGAPLLVTGTASTADGKPLAGAIVDVWHSDNDGHYDVQQLDEIGDLAMRARFRTDENGRFWFWSIKPAAYPIPHDGPVGKMLEAQGRHPWPGPCPFHDCRTRTPDASDACVRCGRSISGLGRRLRRQGQPDPGVRQHAGRNSRRRPRDDAAVFSSEL